MVKIIFDENMSPMEGGGSVQEVMLACTCINHTFLVNLTQVYGLDKLEAVAAITAAVTEAANISEEDYNSVVVNSAKEE